MRSKSNELGRSNDDELKIDLAKVSGPGWQSMGPDGKGLLTFFPACSGRWGNYQFEINNDCDACDFWIVCESPASDEKARVPRGNLIYLPFEEMHVRNYAQPYITQFELIF